MTPYIDNWFSNFHLYFRPMSYPNGVTARSRNGQPEILTFHHPEGFYQAMKNKDPDYRHAVSLMRAGEAKRAGQRTRLRDDWEGVDGIKLKVMDMAVRHKFQVGTPEFSRLLTTTEPVVEINNWHDNCWGDCVCGNADGRHARCLQPGENLLGQLITLIRDQWRLDHPWPAINWHCQHCGALKATTVGHNPYGMEAACFHWMTPCCAYGDAMSLTPICVACGCELIGEDLLGETHPMCEHFATMMAAAEATARPVDS